MRSAWHRITGSMQSASGIRFRTRTTAAATSHSRTKSGIDSTKSRPAGQSVSAMSAFPIRISSSGMLNSGALLRRR